VTAIQCEAWLLECRQQTASRGGITQILSLGSQSLAVSTLAQPQPDWGVQRMICGS